jgi:teichuronic acid exporter
MSSSDSKRMTKDVNRGLAWISLASTLVGVLDIIAIIVILQFWVDDTQLGIATSAIWLFPLLDQATDLGLSAALIQRDDHTEVRVSTVFWINVMAGGVLFLAIVILAPIIVSEHMIVAWMLIAYSTKLLWQNIYLIPVAMMKRQLRFKELSVIRIVANLAEFAGKIGFAAAGFGIWCFVLGPLARVFVTGVGAQLRHPWRPKLICKFSEARDYVTFGLKSSGSQLLFYFYTNIDFPIVGYYFGPTALGWYKLAIEIVLEPVRIISAIIVDVAFPAFARMRHRREALISQFVAFLKLNLIFVMSYAIVMFIAAEDVIEVLFSKFPADQVGAAIQILCFVGVLRSISYVIPPLLDGVGRPDRTFRYMLTASIVLPLMYIAGAIWIGDGLSVVVNEIDFLRLPITVVETPSDQFLAVPIAWAIGYPIAFAVLVYFALHTLEWNVAALLRSMIGVMLCLLASGIVAFAVHWLLAAQPAGLRLGATAVVYVVVMGLLLAYTQGISLRSAKRSLSGDA